MRMVGIWAWTVTAACLTLGASSAAAGSTDLDCGPIATAEQRALEVQVKAVLASAPMQREQARIVALYRADPQAGSPAGRATIERAAAAIANAAAQYIVNDPANAQPMWVTKAPLRLRGVAVGRSGYGIDNPDNVYRNVPIDAAASYEITGRIGPGGPAQLHFTLMDAVPGTTPMSVEGGGFVGTLSSEDMEIGPDGRFTVTIGPEPANGRSNHIQSKGSGKLLMVVRDLFTDWGKQQPAALAVRKTGGPDLIAPTPAELARRSAALLAKIAPYWLAYDNTYLYSRPANAFVAPRLRPGGRGISASGWFSLQDGEALVVTLDPLGAKSLGFQLTDPWGVAYDYIDRTSSLNLAQARPNPDGTITYVIAARDPGAANWLDPSGQGGGIMTIRWQGLPGGVTPAQAVREVRKVSLPLPADIATVSPAERRLQQKERAATYWRRTFGPAPVAACKG